MSTFEALLAHVRENDTQRQHYLAACRNLLNAVVFDITTAVNKGGGHLEAHRDGSGDETLNGVLRMQVQLDLPAPLTFDLFTTHIQTWVGVRPLDEERFEFNMPELPSGVTLTGRRQAVEVFFQALMSGDDGKLAQFTGQKTA